MSVPVGRDEEALMQRLQDRDAGALEKLFDQYHRLALALAYRVVGSREVAEEVVQETFLAVWRQSASYRPERGSARAWLLAIARNRAIDRVRSRAASQPTVELDEGLVDHRTPDVWQQVAGQEQRERILEAMAGLPDDQRVCLDLAYYGGLTHQEIAERLRLPLGTVKGRVRLAMDKLRRVLADLKPEQGGGA